MRQLRACLSITLVLFVLTCVVYPTLVTAAAQLGFSERANGSLVMRDGKVVGSALIGQTFADEGAHPEYLWGRPSAASDVAVTSDGASPLVVTYSGGSNYGPLHPALADEIAARVALLRATGVEGPIPVDLVTKSASGLDPHVSPASAAIQIARIAKARRTTRERVEAIVAAHTEGRTLGLLGEPRVDVLAVNLTLDRELPMTGKEPTP